MVTATHRPKFRPQGGGRQKGTPNLASLDAVAILASVGCEPLLEMAKMAENPRIGAAIRSRLLAELAQYVHPKRRALEVAGGTENKIEITVRSVLSEPAASATSAPGRLLLDAQVEKTEET